ncbi:NgoPII family restriction endonuclease [Methanocalculus sp.]|uniref:NgoPII family restriction endonuclease n=1 Tax=Methanocalculus sp. TaxID=2004547 RepID=UPI0026187573|nr:NgoPII family restriction endonuclease [Methanocalculus sp.]MDG6249757.1 NgoPII family restriction endonuclease [Methanocalculus sp.]
MKTNILIAIMNIVKTPITEINEYYTSHNRANNMGEALEEYVKDMFSGTIKETDKIKRDLAFSNFFSYLGTQNHPPDFILKGGDAVEVKKIENINSGLALNSSYPKAKLFSSSSMITSACRECEVWDEKDIIYAVGVVKGNKLSSLCMFYGIDYAASAEIYERIKKTVSAGISTTTSVEFSETKELGRVNKVDPLGITHLRIRGMWGIENPMKVFKDFYRSDDSKDFNYMALINNEKYKSFSLSDRKLFEKMVKATPDLKFKDIEIKTPDNPAKLKKAKLISFKI